MENSDFTSIKLEYNDVNLKFILMRKKNTIHNKNLSSKYANIKNIN